MAETNQFNIEVGVDTKDSISKLKELGSTLEGVASSVKGSTSSMSSSFTAMTSKLGSSLKSVGATMSVGLTAPLALLGTSLFKSAAQMEQISVSFEVFTGSAETAKNMLTQLKEQALKSPMQFQDIAKGAQTLLGYGLTAEQVIPITRMLGDISGGNADKFGRLSLAFGQVNASGRLMGQEVRQMINAGFNPLQAISEKTGESMASLSSRMREGKISVQEVANAFTYATTEGGRFFGNADKQSQTLQGQLNKLQESVSFALAEIGTSLANNAGVKQFFESLTATVTKVKDAFLSLSPQTQSLILKLALLVAAVGPVLVIFGSLISAIASIASAIGVLGVALSGMGAIFATILVGVALVVAGLVAIGKEIYNEVNAVRDFREEIAELNKEAKSATVSSLTQQIADLNKEIEKQQKIKEIQFFDTVAIEKADKQIEKFRNQIINLQKISEKVNPTAGFSSTPTGLDKKTKVKQEPVEIITGTDFITRDEGSKIKRLIELNKDAALKISEIWLTGTEKKLAKLKSDYELEIQDYIKYQLDYTNITKKYEETRKQIIQQAQNERETSAVKAQLEELAGLQMSYPRSLDDFANDLLNNDLINNLKNYGEAFYAATKDFNVNLAAGFADIAGNALVTGMSLQDTFKSLGAMVLSSLGDYLIKIGTAAIAAGTVGTILKAFFTGGAATVPELGIAGGMAAVAVGSAMKALSGKVSDSMSKTNMPSKSGSTASSVSSKASGASYQYGGASYSTQSVRLMVDLTGSITATQTGYSINKSLETTLRVTGR
jgi:tape measure domain-containing protein